MLTGTRWFRRLALIGIISLLLASTAARSVENDQWLSLTFDNDIFLGDDSGYTNGIFFSGFNDYEDEFHEQRSVLLKPLLWTMPSLQSVDRQAAAFTFGQMLGTPNDISLADPPLDEPPYAALLFFSKSFVQVASDYADQITTTIGIVGPAALGKQAQTVVHRITGSEPPMGWDTQIGDELVFSFSRGRMWRNWVSAGGNADFLSVATADIGTFHTGFSGKFYLRYGRGLKRSFATALLSDNRVSNPISVETGWYVYAGLSAGSRLRMILLDGNTFKNSRSVDYKREFLGATVGATYAWSRAGLSFAISDNSLLQQLHDDKLDKVTQYGSLTFAWLLGSSSERGPSWFFETPDKRNDRER